MQSLTEKLVHESLSKGYFWNCFSRIDFMEANNPKFSDTMTTLWHLALMLGFMISTFQIALLAMRSMTNKENPFSEIIPLLFKTIIVSTLISPWVYRHFMGLVIAGPANAAADMITQMYVTDFQANLAKIMDGIANSNSSIIGVISAALDGSLISSIVSMMIFAAAAICIFIMPMLQSVLFLYAYYLGPICIVFCLFEVTAPVFRAWLGFSLAIAWVGFFGSLSFYAAQSMGVMSNLADSTQGNDFILVAIHGFCAIVVFCSAYPIAAYFFGGAGAIANTLNPKNAVTGTLTGGKTGAAIAGAVGMGIGGMAKLSGEGLNKMGFAAAGSTMSQYGSQSFKSGSDLYKSVQPGGVSKMMDKLGKTDREL